MYHMWEEEEDEEETSFAYIITYDYIICMLKSCGKKASYEGMAGYRVEVRKGSTSLTTNSFSASGK